TSWRCTTTWPASGPPSTSRTSGARAPPATWPTHSAAHWTRSDAPPARRTTEPSRPLLRRNSAMSRIVVRACAAAFAYWVALAPEAPAAEPATLKLLQTIPLKGAPGRLDHMALDSKG